MSRVFLIAVLFAVSTVAPEAQSGGAVQGTVKAADTDRPLSGARVTLTVVTAATPVAGSGTVVSGALGGIPAEATVVAASTGSSRTISSITTETDGKFSFQNLEPGLYTLHVLRDGYARQSYGQRIVGGSPTALRVIAGQSAIVGLTLIPAGNVSGAIRSPEGRPQAGVPVQLLRATYNSSGQRTFQVEGTARTNDRGEYRLYWVTPGRYYLAAGTPAGPNRPVNPNNITASPNEIPERSFVLTYYPGVSDARGAGLIDINPGGEINGIDFTVVGQQLQRIRGRIVDSDTGRPPRGVGLSLAYRTLTGNSAAFSAGEKYNPATGEFELRNVPAGSYVVQAIASDEIAAAEGETLVRVGAIALRANARVPVEVSDTDVDGVELRLSAGVNLRGRITVDGLPLSSVAGWERVRVPLKPTLDSAFGPNVQPAAPVPQAPSADGTFVISGVSPGEFTVGPIAGLPAGLYIKEARFSQTDVLSQPLRFSGVASSPLEIVLSAKASQLDGTALDRSAAVVSGARVVLVPDRMRGRIDLYRTTLSDSAGRFVFRSVPPGDYRVFGWEALESYGYFNPDVLRAAEPQSTSVHVGESAGMSVTLKVIPLGQ
jgi:hypothetical protein